MIVGSVARFHFPEKNTTTLIDVSFALEKTHLTRLVWLIFVSWAVATMLDGNQLFAKIRMHN